MTTLDILIPVGPGHEHTVRDALASVESARAESHPFASVNTSVGDDSAGAGRSLTRNQLVQRSDADWLFFLDADDLMAPHALSSIEPYIHRLDGVWGLIVEEELRGDGWAPQRVKLRKPQAATLDSLLELVQIDPFQTLQMGHFVRRELALKCPFREDWDAGEDFDYYLRAWQHGRCAKVREVFMVNRRGNHAGGPRAATGKDWRRNCRRALETRQLFTHLQHYETIMVTGAHRSGTTIAAQMIAFDTHKRFLPEETFDRYDATLFRQVAKEDAVIQAPALFHLMQEVSRDDLAVVFMDRPDDEVAASRERMYLRDGTRLEPEKQIETQRELLGEVGDPTTFKRRLWATRIARKLHHPYTLEYRELEKHLLWVPEARRRSLGKDWHHRRTA